MLGRADGPGVASDRERSAPQLVVEVATVAIGSAAILTVGWLHRQMLSTSTVLAAVVAVSTWLAVIDLREHRLPNRIVGPLALAVTVWVVVAGVMEGDGGRPLRAIGFGLALAAVLLVANLTGGLGMGDVKYAYPVGVVVGWFGWDALTVTILVTTVAGALVAVGVLLAGLGRRYRLSYGPYMALGMVAGLLSAGPA